ncbi:MAG: ABC transporter substrate-binding protein [Candidatus Cloacimonas sp.]
MRKLIAVILMIFILLAGCKSALQSNKVRVTFWHGLSGPLGDTLNKMVREFNKTHKDVEVIANPISSYTALSQKLMASIQAKKQPDIAQVFESWTSKYIEAGVLCNFEDLMKADSTWTMESLNDIYPVFLKSNTFNDTIYSFPFNKSVRAYFYNKDAFYRAGLDPNHFPTTWDEFRAYCHKLTIDNNNDGKPETYGTNFNVNEWQFINLLYQAGGTILDDNGKPRLNSPQGVEALSYVTDLLNKDKTVYLVREFEGQNDFLAGIAAMYEGSSVSITHMRQQPINFNIGYAPLPVYRTSKSAVSGTNIVIFKSGDKKREQGAWEFIKWFTDTNQTARWSAETCYMPVRKSAMQSPVLQNFLKEYPQFQGIYNQLETAIFEPQISAWFKARLELKNYLEKAMRGISTPKQALDEMNDKFQSIINEEQYVKKL